MHLGMVGLGRMGLGLTQRLLAAGHTVVGYDINANAVTAAAALGAIPALSVEALTGALPGPRAVWLMVPAAFTEATIESVATRLEPGDVIIDGGNTDWRADIDRAPRLAERGVHYVDIGTSGGVHGAERGFCLMIGGRPEVVDSLTPILDALAPGVEIAPRTPGRAGEPTPEERGWLHCGPAGAGHFVKMVHNGIEYGLMAAYAEGFALLAAAGAGAAHGGGGSAEHAPLAHPEHFAYDVPLDRVAELWRRGSVIPSWLLDLTAAALYASPTLDSFSGRVSDSGEGRWTIDAAVSLGVPTPTLASALLARFASQGNATFANQVQSAMRARFGGHAELPPTAG
jgi:6-phosphogluconate dehydrogenase